MHIAGSQLGRDLGSHPPPPRPPTDTLCVTCGLLFWRKQRGNGFGKGCLECRVASRKALGE